MRRKQEFKYDSQDPWKHSIDCLMMALSESCARLGWRLEIEMQTNDVCRATARLQTEQFLFGIAMNFLLDSPTRGIVILKASESQMPQDNRKLVLQECVSLITTFEREGTRLLNLLAVQIDEQAVWVFESGTITQFIHGVWRLKNRRENIETNKTQNAKSKRGPRTISIADKIAAYRAWQEFDRDANAITLEEWLDKRFGNENGVLNVKPSTFYSWRKFVETLREQ